MITNKIDQSPPILFWQNNFLGKMSQPAQIIEKGNLAQRTGALSVQRRQVMFTFARGVFHLHTKTTLQNKKHIKIYCTVYSTVYSVHVLLFPAYERTC